MQVVGAKPKKEGHEILRENKLRVAKMKEMYSMFMKLENTDLEDLNEDVPIKNKVIIEQEPF